MTKAANDFEEAASLLHAVGGGEADYDLMVDEQNMLVQYQREVTQQRESRMDHCANWVESSVNSNSNCQNRGAPVVNATSLNDLTVAELKLECKKRSLPVSGPKPNLITKLQSYEGDIIEQRRASVSSDVASPESKSSSIVAAAASTSSQQVIQNYLQSHTSQPSARTPMSACSDTSGIGSECSGAEMGMSLPQMQMQSHEMTNLPLPSVHVNGMQLMQQAPLPQQQQQQQPTVSAVCAQNTDQMLRTIPTDDNLSTNVSLHEQMLQSQQEKIDILQSELNRAQQQLRHQHKTILAARRRTMKVDEVDECASGIEEQKQYAASQWLSKIDTQQLQKFHIQLFLHYKLQQQQMQSHLVTACDIAKLNAQLRDELVIQQCTAEIVHMIRSQPHIVVRICQLMRRINQGVIQVVQPTQPVLMTHHQPSHNGSFVGLQTLENIQTFPTFQPEVHSTEDNMTNIIDAIAANRNTEQNENRRKRAHSVEEEQDEEVLGKKCAPSDECMQSVFEAVLSQENDLGGHNTRVHDEFANNGAVSVTDDEDCCSELDDMDNLLDSLQEQSDNFDPDDITCPVDASMLNDLLCTVDPTSAFDEADCQSNPMCTTPPMVTQQTPQQQPPMRQQQRPLLAMRSFSDMMVPGQQHQQQQSVVAVDWLDLITTGNDGGCLPMHGDAINVMNPVMSQGFNVLSNY